MTAPEIKFRVYDTFARKMISMVGMDWKIKFIHGRFVIEFDRKGLIPLLYTGSRSPSGAEIFEGDLVEVFIKTDRGLERTTDCIHWEDGAWRVGTLDGIVSDFTILGVVGNRFENVWPALVGVQDED